MDIDLIPKFGIIQMPETNPHTKVKDCQFEAIDEDTRVYYRAEDGKNGFVFYACHVVSHSGEVWNYEQSKVECLFWGVARFDGARRLYVGDGVTGAEGYLYYPDLNQLSAILLKVKELETRFCQEQS